MENIHAEIGTTLSCKEPRPSLCCPCAGVPVDIEETLTGHSVRNVYGQFLQQGINLIEGAGGRAGEFAVPRCPGC
jgi:hypothetical protein